MPENWGWRTRQLLTCRCVSVMLLRSMQNTTAELADAKAENDALRDDVAAGRRRLHISSSSVSAWSYLLASGVDNAASPRLADTAERIISPSREADQLCKNNWKEPRSILIVSRYCPYRWATHAIIVSNTHALPAEYKCSKVIKNRAIHLRMFAGFWVLTRFSAPPQILAASRFSSAQFQKRRSDGWWFCYFAAGLFWTVNVCWAHPAISRASAVASSIFHGVIPEPLFEVRRIVCVEN